jgi:hypothetical protein
MQTPDVSLELFGGILLSDGGGYYPGLELMNLIYGCVGDILPITEAPEFVWTAQDVARRIVWDQENYIRENFGDNPGADVIDAFSNLAHLLKCLQVEVPGRKSTNWEAAHFFPYTKSLIHWDARKGRSGDKAIQMERRYLRGGGALAHKVLRRDADLERLSNIRLGFRDLMPSDQSTPLESLAAALAGKGTNRDASTDPIETQAMARNDQLDELYRAGTARILSHCDLSSTSRIRALILFTGFWLAICQRDRASERLELERTPIVIDCGNGPSQLRRESARALKEVIARIGGAAQSCLPEAKSLKEKRRHDRTRQSLSGFFTKTAAWIGLLNALTGRRFFVMKLDLLEALVLSHVPPGDEMAFDDFTEILYVNYGLVIGRDAAVDAGFLNRLDGSIFEDNETSFASQLLAAGLMHAYSDTTRMVRTKTL